jgi:hypothetical protein
LYNKSSENGMDSSFDSSRESVASEEIAAIAASLGTQSVSGIHKSEPEQNEPKHDSIGMTSGMAPVIFRSGTRSGSSSKRFKIFGSSTKDKLRHIGNSKQTSLKR